MNDGEFKDPLKAALTDPESEGEKFSSRFSLITEQMETGSHDQWI